MDRGALSGIGHRTRGGDGVEPLIFVAELCPNRPIEPIEHRAELLAECITIGRQSHRCLRGCSGSLVSNELGDPRYPTAAKKIAARRARPTLVPPESLPVPAEQRAPRAALTRQFVPEIQGHCEFLEGDTPARLADRLIERLRADGALS